MLCLLLQIKGQGDIVRVVTLGAIKPISGALSFAATWAAERADVGVYGVWMWAFRLKLVRISVRHLCVRNTHSHGLYVACGFERFTVGLIGYCLLIAIYSCI